MYAKYIKRILDFTLSLIGLILLSPVFFVMAICIKLDSKGSVFFLQERVGKDQKIFKIIKFRTMVVNAEHIGDGLRVKQQNDYRITKVGRILRKTSIDEIPQLFNVIKGDMSLIGPRPPVTYHPYKIGEYDEIKMHRFDVRPGITGLAQAELRNAVPWDVRITKDIEYIQKISLCNDIKIIMLTIKTIMKRENLYKEDLSK